MELVVWVAASAAFVAAYMIWFRRMSAGLRGPRVWPFAGSLPGLLLNADRLHEWIADNLRATGGTYQTCICAVPFLSRRQGLVTVTCDPRNMEHVLRARFDNYPKGPVWHAVFHDLLGDGIFNSDGNDWIQQRKTASPEFSSRSLRLALSRWVSRSIHHRLFPILDAAAAADGSPVELQDLLLRLTFDNICCITFSRDPETLASGLPANPFGVAFDLATEATLQRLILPEALWKFRKWLGLGMEADLSLSVSHLDLYIRDIITVCKLELSSGDAGDDLISRDMRKGDYPGEFLKNVARNFILAGRDTSSVALSWFSRERSMNSCRVQTLVPSLSSQEDLPRKTFKC